jgi:hypothetical protein
VVGRSLGRSARGTGDGEIDGRGDPVGLARYHRTEFALQAGDLGSYGDDVVGVAVDAPAQLGGGEFITGRVELDEIVPKVSTN